MEIKLIRFRQGLSCPHCRGRWIVLWGTRKEVQRYRCRDCGKCFNDRTGTPMAYTKLPAKWTRMAAALQQSMTMRRTAEYLDVCLDTAFRWRHRMLAGVSQSRRVVKLSGIVELDATFFRYSEKGARKLQRKPCKQGRARVCAVIGKDRTGETRSFILGRMSGQALQVEARGAIGKESIVCSDCLRSFKTFALRSNLRHIGLNTSKGRRLVHGIYHIQNVNSYRGGLKAWIRRFRGVATKYLLNYLVWYEHLDDARKLQRGLGEQRMFISAFSTTDTVSAA